MWLDVVLPDPYETVQACPAGLLTQINKNTIALYNWQGQERWCVNLPVPDRRGWPAATTFTGQTWSLAPDGRVLVLVTAAGNAILVQAWRDGKPIWQQALPCRPGHFYVYPNQSYLHTRELLNVIATDDGNAYVMLHEEKACQVNYLEQGRLMARGEVAYFYWISSIGGFQSNIRLRDKGFYIGGGKTGGEAYEMQRKGKRLIFSNKLHYPPTETQTFTPCWMDSIDTGTGPAPIQIDDIALITVPPANNWLPKFNKGGASFSLQCRYLLYTDDEKANLDERTSRLLPAAAASALLGVADKAYNRMKVRYTIYERPGYPRAQLALTHAAEEDDQLRHNKGYISSDIPLLSPDGKVLFFKAYDNTTHSHVCLCYRWK